VRSDIYRNDPELAKEKLGRPGGQNGKAVPVQVFDTAGTKMGEFGYLRGCAVISLGIIIRVGNKSLCDKPMYTHGFICVSST